MSQQAFKITKPKRTFKIKKKVQEDPNEKKSFTQQSQQLRNVLKKQNQPQKQMQSQNIIKNDDKNQIQEIEENEENLQKYIPDVDGPQLKLETDYISFIQTTGLVQFNSITCVNNGSASIYYEWKKIQKQKEFNQSLLDTQQKFFLHHEQNVIKPGQSKKFVFAFISKLTGTFEEQWELKCEPPTTTPLKPLKLVGQAIKADPLKEWREDFEITTENAFRDKVCKEIVGDIIGRVRTPTPPLPDFENLEVRRKEFEEVNSKQCLYYNQTVYNLWRRLERDLREELNLEQAFWDLNVDFLKQLIEQVEDDEFQKKHLYEQRFYHYLEMSKKKAIEYSEEYCQVNSFLLEMSKDIIKIADETRKEIDIPDYNFPINIQQIEENEEEVLQQMEADNQKLRAEWQKKTKKKKQTEEDQKKDYETFQEAVQSKLSQQIGDYYDNFERNGQYQLIEKIIGQGDSIYQPNNEYFQQIQRKILLKDIEIEGKRILLKFHLDQNTTEEAKEIKTQHEALLVKQHQEQLAREEEERLLQEKQLKEKKKIKKPVQKKQQEQVQEQFNLNFLDQNSIANILDTLQYCIEKQCKLILVMVSYDEPIGEFQLEKSLKFFFNHIKQSFDYNILFMDSTIIPNYEEKIENDAFPDNTIIFFENVFFNQGEIGINSEKNQKSIFEKQQYYNIISNYTPVFIQDDKTNLFNDKLASVIGFKCEQNVVGLQLGNIFQTLSHVFLTEVSPRTLIVGGELSSQKINALYQIRAQYDQIVFLGEIGINFMLVEQKIDRIGTFQIKEGSSQLIQSFIEKLREEGKEVLIPNSIIMSKYKLPEEEVQEQEQTKEIKDQKKGKEKDKVQKMESTVEQIQVDTNSQEYFENLIQNQVTFSFPLEEEQQIPEDLIPLEFNPEWVEQLISAIQQTSKLVVFEKLSIFNNQYFNNITQALCIYLSQRIEEQKQKFANLSNTEKLFYDFNQDIIVSIIGDDLKQEINKVVLEDVKKKTPEETQENQSDINQSEAQDDDDANSMQTAVVKPKTMQIVSNFYLDDSQFVLKMLQGDFVRGIENIDSYPEKENDPMDGVSLSFLDDKRATFNDISDSDS